MFEVNEAGNERERLFSLRRIRNLSIGLILALITGGLIANCYISGRYGGSLFDVGSGRRESPNVGKMAFDRNTGLFLGVIRGEGRSPARGEVFYVERAGGPLIEVTRSLVEVREGER